MTPRALKAEAGSIIRVRGLRWDEGWEFDCPTVIIDPVLRVHEDGCSLEHAIESLLIDACIDGEAKDHKAWRWDGATGGALSYLRRKYYRRNVERVDLMVRFVRDRDGLTWEELPGKQATADAKEPR